MCERQNRSRIWLRAIGVVLGCMTAVGASGQNAQGIDQPLYAGNLVPIVDEYGRVMRGSPYSPNSRPLVEVRVATNGIIRPPDTNGIAHPYHPLVTSNSVGGVGQNAAATNSGLFCLAFPKRPAAGTKIFARVFNAPTAAEATFYADSVAETVPTNGNAVVFTFSAMQPLNPADSDGDGLNDSWEELLGINDRLTSDYDGDGMSDLHEMLAGTAPDDPNSKLAFRSVSRALTSQVAAAGEPAARPVSVKWQSVPGKKYQLEYVLQRVPDPATGESHEVIPVGDVVTAGEGEYDIEMVVDLPEDALTGVFRVKLVP